MKTQETDVSLSSDKRFPTHRKGTDWIQGISGSEVATTSGVTLVVSLSGGHPGPTAQQHFGCFT